MDARWHIWVDRGGTFTDVVARAPDGELSVLKLLSSDPNRREDAAIAAMRILSGAGPDDPLPNAQLRIGTTIATNALLERKGARVLLAITRGFGDALSIGYQARPDLFTLRIEKPAPLAEQVLEIDERIAADGNVLRALDEAAALAGFQAARADGIDAIAIVLMHGFRHPAHEERLAQLAREAGFTQVSVSHRVGPLIKLIGRGDTTVADAYLSPALGHYVAALERELAGAASPLFMQSGGGLSAAAAFSGKDAILSGPAGGIVGMVRTAAAAGFDRLIGFDMGGTSTDVSHYAGTLERDNETMIAGARIRAPMMRIHTVAAGGGSICAFDGVRLKVGPESAGAVPGPACYRRGGPLTVTDCNVILGKVQPDHFPAVFGEGGDEPIDPLASAARMDEMLLAMGSTMRREEAAEGLIAIAVANMANAIKRISVARGHDAADHVLVCFGGAGGQHACRVADALGMEQVMIHPLAGVLSAYGMGLADRGLLREATVALELSNEHHDAIDAAIGRVTQEARDALSAQGVALSDIVTQTRLSLRYAGTDSLFEVPLADEVAMRADFEAQHRARFGFVGSAPLIVEAVQVEATEPSGEQAVQIVSLPPESAPPIANVTVWTQGAAHVAPLHRRETLAAGAAVAGPALIIDAVSTTMVEPGWQARVDASGNLILSRHMPRAQEELGTAVDPVRLEIMSGLFMAIAEEMGAALQHSASSVNIRERLDFSCALFDAPGNLVANAPHMPVHLGSMGDSIRAVMDRDGPPPRPGDVFALNAPYRGGTHLPDITVVMPVFLDDTGEHPAFWVAARGHHADVGGIAPGSMPPDSRSVEEEGVLLDSVPIARNGAFLEGEVRALLASGRCPARNIDQNIADLSAQIAACTKGAEELRRISADYGADAVAAYMEHVQAASEAAVRRLIPRLSDGHFRYAMDNGAAVEVTVSVDRKAGALTVDFTGTSAQLPSNFNAPASVVRAAVLYVVRTLVDDAIPMNDGCLRPVRIIIPEGSMLSPHYPAAVVAGNVETSQVVTDALLGALGACAAAQGTMNNFTFGNATHQYYETIAGGSGAGPDFDGADAVQTHMTNSRLTDPEILETRFPVLLEQFAVRRGSGGTGRHHGGDGVIRRVRFLEDMTAGMLANRRVIAPFGLEGGADGATGRNWIERAGGSREELGACASVAMRPGDTFVIETPGGGGYGRA